MRTAYVILLLSLAPAVVAAQIQWAGSLSLAGSQQIGKFRGEADSDINTSLKGQNPFSPVRARLFADTEIADRFQVFMTILYDEGLGHFEMEGAYVVMPSVGGHEAMNLQIGKMATPFGRFAARSFATANPVIGTPLIYQYFSAIQGKVVPANVDQQLAWRHDRATYRGQPTVYDACWNTGVQLFGSLPQLAYAVAVTRGTLSNPDAADNDGVAVVGRVGLQPTMGWQIGASASYGPYLQQSAYDAGLFTRSGDIEDYSQLVFGMDTQYSVWHCEVIAEVLHSRWEVANVDEELSLWGGYVEASARLRPRLSWALRVGHMRYSDILASDGTSQAWDDDITRVESGLEFYLARQAHVKAVWQHNRWANSAVSDVDLVGMQLAIDF
ncbi:MAG: hypothetical protein HOM68_02785 [Gemmatimonadetes bacterium]|jgi:hypothetical protein|nr:hypothetical protein [Gemmatimonadota bacterium]MBT4611290.1 hypothetical protein [Gemmatimonadota bacterium]MBT5055444.1 hypothetical protein [Gemmatimonadota bacterium]MBT5143436.1 hypothetical protein [Gemmatimonadota bacterium]MBT5589344.1 hypothetical protein [Gemmatimonadota bacterium]